MLLRDDEGFSLSYHGDTSAQNIRHADWRHFYQEHHAYFETNRRAVFLVPPIHEKDLEHLAQEQYGLVIEASSHTLDLKGPLAEEALQPNQPFFISLTTATAFHMPLSFHVSTALQKALSFDDAAQQGMESCLQEAISNALIHGNLAVKSAQHTGSGAAELFLYDMNRRLAQSPWRDRRITISARQNDGLLSLIVDDEGDGFDVEKIMKPDAIIDPNKPSGRGAHIIRELTHDRRYENGGRRLILDFLLA